VLRFKDVPGFPAALTAIREFHRLRARWRRVGVLTIEEARQLADLRAIFEPPGEGGDDWNPVLIVDRRPVLVSRGRQAARGELVAFALRTALVRVAFDVRLNDLVRVAIPRFPDGKWHRFVAEVVHLSRGRRRITLRFVRPVGEARPSSGPPPSST
jgi:hypothetical protein